MRFSVSIVREPRFFVEVAQAVRASLLALGHEVEAGRLSGDARNLVLGAHVLSAAQLARLPPRTILLNLEQLEASDAARDFVGRCRGARHLEWWDYSRRNLAFLARQGFAGPARWVPLGFSPTMCRVANRAEPDIDVLFYGGLNGRRRGVLHRLRRACRCVVARDHFGVARDRLIGRAKLVVNIHYYDTAILEMPRIVYLLANGKAVVSERNPSTEIEPWVEQAIATAPYERLAEACLDLLADDPRRRRLADAALAHARGNDMTAALAAALADEEAAARQAG